MTPPSGIAVVVSYNSAAELPGCLESLRAQRGVALEVHVVDNASRDGSAELVRTRYPWVTLIANHDNRGFARATNQVLEANQADFFALVNPDTVLDPDAVAAGARELAEHPEVGIVATRLEYPDGTLQPSCHSFLGLTNLLGETLLLDRLFPGWEALSSLNLRGFAHDRRREVDWIQGAFLVVRGRLCRETGVFDPDFFMYGEEMDWCYRARRDGWKVVFLARPTVMHVGGASSQPIAGPMFVETLKSRLRFLRKHRGGAVLFVGRLLTAVSVFLRWLWQEIAAVMGRASSETSRTQRQRFRSAMAWVARGLPLSPYEPGS